MKHSQQAAPADPPRGIDRRGRARVDVELWCRAVANGRELPSVIGRTLNISRSGVLIDWNAAAVPANLPRLGEVIRLDIELPRNDFPSRCIRCRGKVVRLSAAGGGAHVAVAIEQMEFRDQSRRAPARRGKVIELERMLQ